jgi:hypothetical protein
MGDPVIVPFPADRAVSGTCAPIAPHATKEPLRRWITVWLLIACDGGEPVDAGAIDAGADAGPDAGLFGCDAGPSPDAGIVRTTETREACADRNPHRNLYFGDLHVHTSLSFDSWALGNRASPEDAYRFARGEEIEIYGGAEPRPVRLARPLDFAAVTDHSELLAETDFCTDPSSSAYDSSTCVTFREGNFTGLAGRFVVDNPSRDRRACPNGECEQRIGALWQRVQDAAEAAYDRTSACSFTSFVGYEYTLTPAGQMLHRNIIFRNSTVPPAPISVFEAPTPPELWAALRSQCTGCEGCEVMSIPHNGNQSAGRMFGLGEIAGLSDEDARRLLELRRDSEPLVEIYQHKGAGECRPEAVLGNADEACRFELITTTTVGAAIGAGPLEPCNGDGSGMGAACWSRLDYVRHALGFGMTVERDRGVNPFMLGVIGSTDTHNGTPGNVDEDSFRGHVASEDFAPLTLLENSAGALAAVWAVENSRDAIFEALLRRETFATSGPRIALRFFGGHGWDASLCADPELVRRGYEEGVPMGGTLGSGSAPSFVVNAMADRAPFYRAQIVKVWVDDDGAHERVFDLGAEPDPTLGVDDACEPVGTGVMSLCEVWTDPEWDPAHRALYYARVLEAPTCRWSALQCLEIPEPDRPEACTDPDVPRTIQERVWSSPIWLR